MPACKTFDEMFLLVLAECPPDDVLLACLESDW